MSEIIYIICTILLSICTLIGINFYPNKFELAQILILGFLILISVKLVDM